MITTILVNLAAHGMTPGGSLAEPENRGIVQRAEAQITDEPVDQLMRHLGSIVSHACRSGMGYGQRLFGIPRIRAIARGWGFPGRPGWN
jgi:hypothetical protein